MRRQLATAFLLFLGLALVACQRSETPPAPGAASAPPPAAPFRVSEIELGNAVGPDKRISAPLTSFAASDTIYASIATEGTSPSVTLLARWTFEDGQVVSETTQVIAPVGPDATEFHIDKPDGLPAGRYRMEVMANGASAGAREFEVR